MTVGCPEDQPGSGARIWELPKSKTNVQTPSLRCSEDTDCEIGTALVTKQCIGSGLQMFEGQL